jgi:nitrogenase subunit NifH
MELGNGQNRSGPTIHRPIPICQAAEVAPVILDLAQSERDIQKIESRVVVKELTGVHQVESGTPMTN